MNLILLLLMILFCANFLYATRNINAISNNEYEILLKKINGEFNIPVKERIAEMNLIIRKYYRWLDQGKDVRVGPSGRTIYVEGLQLIRKNEIDQAIKGLEKETKNSGVRKLTDRIKQRFVGCTEKNVASAKDRSKSIKVSNIFILFQIVCIQK